MRKILILLSLFALLSGCTMFVKEPVVNVRELQVVSLDSAGLGMDLLLSVANPNSFDVRLLGYNYDLKVMALPLAHGGARQQISFPAGTETEMRIPVRLPYGELLEILKRRPDLDRIPYAFSAGFELDTGVGRVTVPVNRIGAYAIPKQYRPAGLLERLGDILKIR